MIHVKHWTKCSRCVTEFWAAINLGQYEQAKDVPPCHTECSAALQKTADLIADKAVKNPDS